MDNLLKLYGKSLPDNTVVLISNLLEDSSSLQSGEHEYYFFKEFVTMKHFEKLPPYGSSMKLITICNQDKFIFQKALTRSIERTKDKLIKGEDIAAE